MWTYDGTGAVWSTLLETWVLLTGTSILMVREDDDGDRVLLKQSDWIGWM